MRFEIGDTVTDRLGKQMLGVVIDRSSYYEDRVIVRAWSPLLTKYTEFPIREDKLELVEDPGVFQTINEDDRQSRRSFKYNAVDISLMTGDPDWFKELLRESPDLNKK